MQLIHILRNIFLMGRMTALASWPLIAALLLLFFSTNKWKLFRPNESHFLLVILVLIVMIVLGGICASQWYPPEGHFRSINNRSTLISNSLFMVKLLFLIGVGLSLSQLFYRVLETTIVLLSILQISLLCVGSFSAEVVITNTWL
jgi:hypothetical protein